MPGFVFIGRIEELLLLVCGSCRGLVGRRSRLAVSRCAVSSAAATTSSTIASIASVGRASGGRVVARRVGRTKETFANLGILALLLFALLGSFTLSLDKRGFLSLAFLFLAIVVVQIHTGHALCNLRSGFATEKSDLRLEVGLEGDVSSCFEIV